MKTLCTIAAAAVLAVSPAAADDIEGVYKGMIFSAGEYPGTTIFTISDEGKIGGTYVYAADGNAEVGAGELKDCWFEARMLRCIWVDDFGKGDFVALFSSDFRSFNGGWFDTTMKGVRPSLEGAFPWTGKRVE